MQILHIFHFIWVLYRIFTVKYFSEANSDISENVKKSHPELLSTTAVNDEVDRTIDDRTKSGDHITFDLPCEDMITVGLFKASNDIWDPIKTWLNNNLVIFIEYSFTWSIQRCQCRVWESWEVWRLQQYKRLTWAFECRAFLLWRL